MWGEMGQTCAVCRDSHIRSSTSGPAGSRTMGLAGSAQWLYPDDPGRGGRQTGRRFSLLIHDTAAVSTAFCSDLICPASPTHKYFTNTSHTRDPAVQAHTPAVTHPPSLILFPSSSVWLKFLLIFIYIYNISTYIPLPPLSPPLSPFNSLQVHSVRGKQLTEDKMQRAVVHTPSYATEWLKEWLSDMSSYSPLLLLHGRSNVQYIYTVWRCISVTTVTPSYRMRSTGHNIRLENCLCWTTTHLEDVSVLYLVLHGVVFRHNSTHDGIPAQRAQCCW